MSQIRIRSRETPKGQIECPLDGTVNPNVDCLSCAYDCVRRKKAKLGKR